MMQKRAQKKYFVNVIKGTQPDMLKFSTELSKDPLIQLGWLWHLLSDVQKLHFAKLARSGWRVIRREQRQRTRLKTCAVRLGI